MIDERRKETIHAKWNWKIYFIYLLSGFKKIVFVRSRRIIVVIVTTLLVTVSTLSINNKPSYSSRFGNLNQTAESARVFLIVLCSAFTFFLFVFLLGKPRGAKKMNDNLKRAGVVNHTGEAPLLLSKTRRPDSERVNVYEFYSAGIPLAVWQDNLPVIESALNLKIGHFEEGRSSRIVKMVAVDGNYTLPKMILWKDDYLSTDENGFVLVLGDDITGEKVTVNLKNIPHLLIGGSTGSGKSVLLKLLLMESVKKGAEVVISDFKGGVDFPSVWNEKCSIITDTKNLKHILTKIVDELETRKVILKKSGLPNIDEYNLHHSRKLNRIIFTCDEVAELLDKTGLSKEAKAEVAEIEGYLSTIARQGRACGIHLILATQRPDANILPGQIKNNLDYRVCGRADLVLSQIILDNGDANDRIPKNAQGRFLDNYGNLFQSFWFDDKVWKSKN